MVFLYPLHSPTPRTGSYNSGDHGLKGKPHNPSALDGGSSKAPMTPEAQTEVLGHNVAPLAGSEGWNVRTLKY